jgi:hypothetical protein
MAAISATMAQGRDRRQALCGIVIVKTCEVLTNMVVSARFNQL